MKVTIAINNYNYSKFIVECVASVINQTYKNIELIIIDDGSTDNSLELIKANFDESFIKVISKKNGGQLSSFNEIKKYVTGEVVFFLDSDDIYKPEYIENIVKIYSDFKDIDFVFCAIERFYDDGTKEVIQKYSSNLELGYSAISTIYSKEWVGSVTSSISMRTDLVNKILPIPFENEWITRADDCLVWGSSIFGAKKYYYAEPLILYRIHGKNNFHGKQFSMEYLYKRELSIIKLFYYLKNKAKINEDIINLTALEFYSREDKSIKNLWLYISILKFQNGFLAKLKKVIRLIQIYIQFKKGKK